MHRTLRFPQICLLSSYLLISILPFLSLVLGKSVDHPLRLLTYEALSWGLLWACLSAPRWFHFLLFPAFLAIPVEVYLRLYYGQGISTHHLGIITETSPKEAMEFLGNRIWLLALITATILGWWLSLLKAAKHCTSLNWHGKTRWWCLTAIFFIAIAWGYGARVGVASKSSSASTSTSFNTDSRNIAKALHSWTAFQEFLDLQDPLPNWAESLYDFDTFSSSWPMGIWARSFDFYLERRYLSELSEKNRNFRFQAHQAASEKGKQTIVVVIGESSRYDRWSINGYHRPTNPYLSQEENLVSFTDMITAVAATRLSVPIITTRKPATQSLKAGFHEKSFLSAYKEAGFKTFWISNQMSFGQFDTPSSVIAKEADVTQFLNLGGFTNTSSYDQILLKPLQSALDDDAANKLIVIHSLGNHWNYSHRYPEAYDKWKPSLFGVANPAYTNLKNKEALNNSYDNSILYNDWVLARMITQLKALPDMTALWYVSDHGQTLYDGTCNLAFHGHNTQYEFHIPAFVWYSDQYATRYPQKIEQLKTHREAKLSTENVFHSVVDMVDIRYPDERLERSVFSPKWQYQTRFVDSYGWTHYDDSHLKGDCREVIDNQSALTQDK